MSAFTDARDKTRWEWTLLLLVPEWIARARFDTAVEAVRAKGSSARLGDIRLELLAEGQCVQTLHAGSFDDEGPLLARMHGEFIPGERLRMTGPHHEIYLSDARRVVPAKPRSTDLVGFEDEVHLVSGVVAVVADPQEFLRPALLPAQFARDEALQLVPGDLRLHRGCSTGCVALARTLTPPRRSAAHNGGMRLADARLLDGTLIDIDILDGVIERVSPAGSTPSVGERRDLAGATVIPGLWDEHTHLGQWARHRTRRSVLDAASVEQAAAAAGEAARAHTGAEPLVLVGMRDGLWPAAPTRELLDAATGAVPTLVISSDVHCSWPNTAMLERLGLTASEALLREEAAFAALDAVERMLDADTLDRHVVEALAAAAARGVVGVVDFEFDDAVGAWMRPGRATPTRIEAGIYGKELELAAERGLRTGDPIAHRARVGRLKVISDGSLGTRTAWTAHPYGTSEAEVGAGAAGTGVRNVDEAELDRLLARARQLGLEAAIHAIGDAAVTAALDAFERAGTAGRIEHAQLVAGVDIPRMARLRVVASVQPEHALDDRELIASLWADRSRDAYRLRSLVDAGVAVVLGSDAPVTPLDPWLGIATAVTRTRGDELPWQPEEALVLEQAIAASSRSRIAAEQPADLVVLGAALPQGSDPNEAAASLRRMPVALTLIAGDPVFDATGHR